MKSLTEQPAILSVHQGAPGQYLLRVSDLRYRPLVIEVSKLLEDAKSLVVITPSDIKVFAVNGTGRIEQEQTAEVEPSPEEAAEIERAIAEQESHPLPNTDQQEEPAETPAQTRTRRRPRHSETEIAGHAETCQRCRGTGRIAMMMENGKGTEITCPICRGEGHMRRYGSKR